MSPEEFRAAGKKLYDMLHLPTYPVAVTYVRQGIDVPKQALRPSAQGQKWSFCQAYTYARRWGWHVAMTAQDNFCVPASAMHRWVDVSAEEFIESQVQQGWHKDREAEKNRYAFAQGLFQGPNGDERRKKIEACVGFVCSPLAEATLEPDTVLVFGDGSHLTHLIHALCYDYTSPVMSTFEGFGETCVKGAMLPFLTGRAQVVIPGMGDRAFTGVQDHEIAFGLPANLLPAVVENLFKSGGRLNMGQPVKTLLPMGLTESITPGFAYLKEKADERRKAEK
jgi:uncharacterized protein (DUF169 family)